eukprot:CAMPEP_0174695374 /NCGR_PEP_ID=MMETSP1094-20130205/1758_1 /TAXON_ID=156173 /ORGANISM="Chrysochromulina brevifilum, Strain UTEX LB 985" /LENGTH=101 /DNA_ID=CAMNT_0015891851 /DNA_START=250 /DNA_END=556 /DNA_ORIENTATION=-
MSVASPSSSSRPPPSIDLVRVVGKHVREQAATILQKWARGSSVRLAWDMPGLCDGDGELVVYGQLYVHVSRAAFPIFSSGRVTGLEHSGLDLTLDEMEEVD